jgi:hypothetical protein
VVPGRREGVVTTWRGAGAGWVVALGVGSGDVATWRAAGLLGACAGSPEDWAASAAVDATVSAAVNTAPASRRVGTRDGVRIGGFLDSERLVAFPRVPRGPLWPLK